MEHNSICFHAHVIFYQIERVQKLGTSRQIGVMTTISTEQLHDIPSFSLEMLQPRLHRIIYYPFVDLLGKSRHDVKAIHQLNQT